MTRTPSQTRSLLLSIADQLDPELTLQELISFLPSSTCEEFMDHLCDVADITDLIPANS